MRGFTRFFAIFAPAALLAAELASAAPIPNISSSDFRINGTATTSGQVITASVSTPAPDANSVLILDATVTGGLASNEATKASALGFTVVVVNDLAWGAMTTADFASYRALILGDPTCVGGTGPIAAAEANTAVWGPAVNGNVIIVGTDPTYHESQGGGVLTSGGIDFAGDDSLRTGAYITLSCYYAGAVSGTPVPVLVPFGSFTVVGQGGCPQRSHIIASHPALAGITDATLSNWGCSTHEGFVSWPALFDPLAISLDVPSSYMAPDGTNGAPYILARGATPISYITLTPDSATNNVEDPHTICALVTKSLYGAGAPQAGVQVCFEVLSGPCGARSLGCVTTNASGVACTTYTCTSPGTDIIEASFVDSVGRRFYTRATKNWIIPPNADPICDFAVASDAVLWPPNHKYRAISILGVTDPDGDPVTITVTKITQDEPLNTRGDGNTCPDAQIVNGQASVRAERSGTPGIPGNGRVYVISFTASDGQGGECRGSVSVCVPHDQGNGSVCIDDGRKFDSLGPCTGSSRLSKEITEVGLTIGEVTLAQATVEFSLPQDAQVEVAVFDVAGRRLATVEDGPLAAGVYQRAWDMSGATKGLYFVRLRAGAVTLTKTVVKIN